MCTSGWLAGLAPERCCTLPLSPALRLPPHHAGPHPPRLPGAGARRQGRDRGARGHLCRHGEFGCQLALGAGVAGCRVALWPPLAVCPRLIIPSSSTNCCLPRSLPCRTRPSTPSTAVGGGVAGWRRCGSALPCPWSGTPPALHLSGTSAQPHCLPRVLCPRRLQHTHPTLLTHPQACLSPGSRPSTARASAPPSAPRWTRYGAAGQGWGCGVVVWWGVAWWRRLAWAAAAVCLQDRLLAALHLRFR